MPGGRLSFSRPSSVTRNDAIYAKIFKIFSNCIMMKIYQFPALGDLFVTDFDLAIMRVLQDDCSLSLEAVSSRVNLSVASCQRRMKALEAAGYIVGRSARLDPKALGFSVTGIYWHLASSSSS